MVPIFFQVLVIHVINTYTNFQTTLSRAVEATTYGSQPLVKLATARGISLHQKWLLIATSGCEPQAVANSNKWMPTTSGLKPRVAYSKAVLISRAVANHKWLLTQLVAWFLKIGICIDDEIWKKDWYH